MLRSDDSRPDHVGYDGGGRVALLLLGFRTIPRLIFANEDRVWYRGLLEGWGSAFTVRTWAAGRWYDVAGSQHAGTRGRSITATGDIAICGCICRPGRRISQIETLSMKTGLVVGGTEL